MSSGDITGTGFDPGDMPISSTDLKRPGSLPAAEVQTADIRESKQPQDCFILSELRQHASERAEVMLLSSLPVKHFSQGKHL